MRKRRWAKYLAVTGTCAAAALSVFAFFLSRNSACIAPPVLNAGAQMSAIMQRCYGEASVLRLEQVAKPTIAADEVLIRVHAASVNPLDKHYMHGTPYVLRLSNGFNAPDDPRAGVDMAGVIEAIGAKVTRFKVGDAVFGAGNGAFADYVVKRATSGIALKPSNLSFEQASAMPIAAVTALQALRDKAGVQPGQRVLINGASGGVGSYAVQLAKAMGAHVTGVCSGRNAEMVRSLGADAVIDYTVQDFTQGSERYDVVIDMVGNHGFSQLLKVVEPQGAIVTVGSVDMNAWWGPFSRPLRGWFKGLFVSQQIKPLLAEITATEMEALARYAAAGQLRSVIDARFKLAEVPDAMRQLETGRTAGKIVINVVP
jgi:NADPH:quinone reductase-like Zn-dependent oxidoreductase